MRNSFKRASVSTPSRQVTICIEVELAGADARLRDGRVRRVLRTTERLLVNPARIVDIPARKPDIMADETSSLLDRPGSDAESPLAAAARHLRATPIPIGAVSARQREVLRGRQVRDLLAWARENSALIDPSAYM